LPPLASPTEQFLGGSTFSKMAWVLLFLHPRGDRFLQQFGKASWFESGSSHSLMRKFRGQVLQILSPSPFHVLTPVSPPLLFPAPPCHLTSFSVSTILSLPYIIFPQLIPPLSFLSVSPSLFPYYVLSPSFFFPMLTPVLFPLILLYFLAPLPAMGSSFPPPFGQQTALRIRRAARFPTPVHSFFLFF